MPSRVRVAGLIGGRAYFGRHILGYLYNVADSAGVLMSKRKKGTTWKDILAAWEVVGKYIDGCKLYIIRERRGVRPNRSLFNQKLLGYKRNKKKKDVPAWAIGNIGWNAVPAEGQLIGRVEEALPPPARRRRLIGVDADGHLAYENR